MKIKIRNIALGVSILLCLMFSLTLPKAVAASPAVITIGTASCEPGTSVIIPIELESNPGVAALMLNIEYDSSRLEVSHMSAISEGTALSRLTFIGVDESTYNQNPIKALWVGSVDDSSVGTLLNIEFTVLQDAPSGMANIRIVLNGKEAIDSKEFPVDLSTNQGSITVLGKDSIEDSEIINQKPANPSFSQSGSAVNNLITQENSADNKTNGQGKQEEIRKFMSKNNNAEISFTDVLREHWHYEAVSFIVSRGLFLGVSDDLFAPDSTMTRGMFLTVLSRLDGIDSSGYEETSFSDVETDSWYSAAISWADEIGIINIELLGTNSDNAFYPDKDITREEMAIIFANYLKLRDFNLKRTDTPEFSDIERASSIGQDSIREMRSLSIIRGIGDNRYEPNGNATRSEVAQIFTNLVLAILESE